MLKTFIPNFDHYTTNKSGIQLDKQMCISISDGPYILKTHLHPYMNKIKENPSKTEINQSIRVDSSRLYKYMCF